MMRVRIPAALALGVCLGAAAAAEQARAVTDEQILKIFESPATGGDWYGKQTLDVAQKHLGESTWDEERKRRFVNGRATTQDKGDWLGIDSEMYVGSWTCGDPPSASRRVGSLNACAMAPNA